MLICNLYFVLAFIWDLSFEHKTSGEPQRSREIQEKWILCYWPPLLYGYHPRNTLRNRGVFVYGFVCMGFFLFLFCFFILVRGLASSTIIFLSCVQRKSISTFPNACCPWKGSAANGEGPAACPGCAGTTSVHAVTKTYLWSGSPLLLNCTCLFLVFIFKTPCEVCKSDSIFHLTDKKAKFKS